MNPAYLPPLANHLWQSTLFAGLAGLLTLALRTNHARVSHSLWLAASCKFLIPFSVLMTLGGHIHWRTAAEMTPSSLSVVMDELSQPFTVPLVSSPVLAAVPPDASPLPVILWGIWACGFLGIACAWWVRWGRIRAAIRAGSPVHLEIPVQAMSSPTFLEPAVFGVFRPVLLLPEGIFERLTTAQWKAVIAHELCHVCHRDNLIAAIHMFVETVFWFHPLVWWIGKRMVEERERACDEEVLQLGSEPRAYAEGILNVCKFYLQSPLACMSGVTGSDLKRRIEAIMAHRIGRNLSLSRRLLLAATGILALAGPFVIGLVHVPQSQAQSKATATLPLTFEVASVKRSKPSSGPIPVGIDTEPGKLIANNDTLKDLITAAYGIKEYQVSGPDWLNSERYDIVAKASNPVGDDQLYQMLRALLADRFKMTLHRETKEFTVYALVVGKNGPKLVRAKDDGGTRISMGGRRLTTQHISLSQFANLLSQRTDRPVLDRTGIAGAFDITLTWTPDNRPGFPVGGGEKAARGDSSDPTIFTAVQEQLGLKLEATKAPLEILVIDHAEKVPTEN